MVVSEKVRSFYHSGSAIRKMFYEGLKLKQQVGEENVADLSIGNPSFPPPKEFTNAVIKYGNKQPGNHAYMHNAGYMEVRNKIAAFLNNRKYLPVTRGEHIIMTTGAAGAINVILKTILNPGDEVIVLRPYFVEYRFYVDNHDGKMILVDVAENFHLDLKNIENAITYKTRALIINSPNNPSGIMYHDEELADLGKLLTHKEQELGIEIFMISDEPYREIRYGKKFPCPASFYHNSFIAYSWSKVYCISGERIGYIAVNPHLKTDNWEMLLGSLAMANRFLGFVNAPAFMQHVISDAVTAELDLTHYTRKREKICNALREAGYEFNEPDGGFYIFPKTPIEEMEFIEKAKNNYLLVVPGKDFGRAGYFRMCYATDEPTIDLACKILKKII